MSNLLLRLQKLVSRVDKALGQKQILEIFGDLDDEQMPGDGRTIVDMVPHPRWTEYVGNGKGHMTTDTQLAFTHHFGPTGRRAIGPIYKAVGYDDDPDHFGKFKRQIVQYLGESLSRFHRPAQGRPRGGQNRMVRMFAMHEMEGLFAKADRETHSQSDEGTAADL